MLGHYPEPALKAFPSFCHQGILKANFEYLLRRNNLLSEWDLRSGSEVGTLYIIINLEKNEASKSVKSLYFNGKLTCIWTGAQQKLADRYKGYGDLSNTWEPKAHGHPHQATRAPSVLRTEEQDWHGGAQNQGVEAEGLGEDLSAASRSTCTFEVKLCERLRDDQQGCWVTIQNQRWKPSVILSPRDFEGELWVLVKEEQSAFWCETFVVG
jgi:hypothetical protein